jgi:hypothetical protein
MKHISHVVILAAFAGILMARAGAAQTPPIEYGEPVTLNAAVTAAIQPGSAASSTAAKAASSPKVALPLLTGQGMPNYPVVESTPPPGSE